MEQYQGIEVHRGAEGAHPEAGRGGHAGWEICRKAGISQATDFNWKKRYGGLLPDEIRRLKSLEDKNTRLKKIVADLMLDREMLQNAIRQKL